MLYIKNKQNKLSIGIMDIVTIILIILKLAGLLKINWVWVLCPEWIFLIIYIILLLIIYIRDQFDYSKHNKSKRVKW